MLKNLKGSLADDFLGQVGGLGKQIGIGVVQAGKDIVKTTPNQIAGKEEAIDMGKKEASSQSQVAQEKDNKDLIQALYGTSKDTKNPLSSSTEGGKAPALVAAEQAKTADLTKTPEEQQKIEMLRQQLHKDYFERTFNNQGQKQQEELVEKQKEQQEEEKKRWELQEKDKKKEEETAVLQGKRKSVEKQPGAG